MYKLTGTVKMVGETVQVTEKFSKREFVINDSSSMYPQDIIFQACQDRCSMLDGVEELDNLEVSFNLRGREWTSPSGEVKYFNTLDAWRVEKVDPYNAGPAPQAKPSTAPTAAEEEEDDDLPF